jgi:hypothetical protein
MYIYSDVTKTISDSGVSRSDTGSITGDVKEKFASRQVCTYFLFSRFVSASLLFFMDPLFLITIDILLYLCLFGWSEWKRIEYRFRETLSL